MDNLFSIGEISRYQHISKQTLIFYDKIGLFPPAYVDPHNGYRYYSAEQIDYLDTILIMKKIGFSLKEIREHMKNYNIDNSLNALRRQLTVLDSQIQELHLIRKQLSHRCEQMELASSYKNRKDSIVVEKTGPQYLLFHKVKPPYSPREVSIATKKCFSDFYQKNLPVFFQCGVSIPLSRIRAGRFTEASTAFLLTEPTDQVTNIQTLPEGTCVSTYHFGDYPSIGRSYRKLLDYCEKHSFEICSDSYEFCINDYITSRDENEYITKILFYVRD